MMRKIKVLGLAFVAVFAMSAVAASAANASTFMAESYPVSLEGSQVAGENHQFTVGGNTVTCTEANFASTEAIGAASEELAITPTYGSCTVFGFVGATVTTTGCHYQFHTGATVEADKFDGTTDVVCSGTNKIIINGAGCEIKIGSQTGLSTVRYENNTTASPKDVKVVANVTGIAGEVTKSSFPCPLKKGAVTGTYTGGTTVKSTNGTGITVED